jgi:hypothetical protein
MAMIGDITRFVFEPPREVYCRNLPLCNKNLEAEQIWAIVGV